MPVTARWYPSAMTQMFIGNLRSSHEIKMALLGSGGTFNPSHVYWSSLSSQEIAAAGPYATGGKIMTIYSGYDVIETVITKSVIMPDPVLWEAASFTVHHAVIYSATTEALMLHIDFGGAQAPDGRDFLVNAPSPYPSATPVTP